MKKQAFITLFALLSTVVNAQTNDPTILTINGKDIRKSEFEYIYKKNSSDEIIDKMTLQEYLELFKNFKLKVTEAQTQGLDTTPAFNKELNEYRNQLAKPYLTNLKLDENLIQQEYSRLKEYYDASHILISIPLREDSTPKLSRMNSIPADTLTAYKKAIQIYKQLMKGDDFAKKVKEISDDERTNTKEHPGHLGWITALMTPPPLEDVIYSSKEGVISMPVRTGYGYHIVKVNGKMPNPGQVRAAHIMVVCPADASPEKVSAAEQKSNAWYEQLTKGEDFAELAKAESEDKSSATSGGDLSWFGIGTMVKEFQNTAFNLKDTGDISKPVRTQFGIHIIKLLDRKGLEPIEEKRAEIIDRLERNANYIALRQPGVEILKKNNEFSFNEKAYKSLINKARTVYPTDSAFIASFKNDSGVLFSTGKTPYTVADFIAFYTENGQSPYTLSTEFLDERLVAFETQCLITAEDANLEKRYPEFRNLINEYRDGILLFDVSNKEVWEKAGKDTAGLRAYFDQNKASYTWTEPHYKGYVVHCKDKKEKDQMMKEIKKLDVDSAANFLIKNYRVGDVSRVKIEKGLFTKGENSHIDELVFSNGKAKPNPEYPEYFVIGKLLNAPNAYSDVRGLVVTDYQNYLEKQWITQLNKKYSVVVHKEVVDSIK